MVTKSVTFLNEFLSKIGFDENEFFTEEEFKSHEEADNSHNIYFVISYREKEARYKGIVFPFNVEATVRPKTDEIGDISIKSKNFEIYSDEYQEIMAEYFSHLTIILSSLISDELYQKIADGTQLQSMYKNVFAYIKEGRIKNWHDHRGILDYARPSDSLVKNIKA